jgi:hypothetical protein
VENKQNYTRNELKRSKTTLETSGELHVFAAVGVFVEVPPFVATALAAAPARSEKPNNLAPLTEARDLAAFEKPLPVEYDCNFH